LRVLRLDDDDDDDDNDADESWRHRSTNGGRGCPKPASADPVGVVPGDYSGHVAKDETISSVGCIAMPRAPTSRTDQ